MEHISLCNVYTRELMSYRDDLEIIIYVIDYLIFIFFYSIFKCFGVL